MKVLTFLSTLGYAALVAGVVALATGAVLRYRHPPKILRHRLAEIEATEKAEQERLARGPQFVICRNPEIAQALEAGIVEHLPQPGWKEVGGYGKTYHGSRP